MREPMKVYALFIIFIFFFFFLFTHLSTFNLSAGGQGDQHTTEGITSSPSRVRARESSPSYANVPSSGRRRVRSRPMEPPRASADWTASPLPQQLFPHDEVPFDSYRMSVDAKHIPSDDYEGGFSSMRIPSPIPEAGSSFVETLFPTDPFSSYWPGETLQQGSHHLLEGLVRQSTLRLFSSWLQWLKPLSLITHQHTLWNLAQA
ncbi:hypothetical protein KFK09_013878 [Dendrobium nobile]|uniref:Uncharacterized protein n=1 Tax=Dendrobium nobile TaxID=94219 RepID=A0A8T3B8E1_DENNO|nr:hypothetical protein KFK09_013878 [Dendrobium nobile]